jgi:hypothetical protein
MVLWSLLSVAFLHFVSSLFHRAEESTSARENGWHQNVWDVQTEKRDVSKCVWQLCSVSFLHFVSSLFHRAEESTSESETVPPAQQNNLASLFFGFLFPYPSAIGRKDNCRQRVDPSHRPPAETSYRFPPAGSRA